MNLWDAFLTATDLPAVPVIGALSTHPQRLTDFVPCCTGFPGCLQNVPAATGQQTDQMRVVSQGLECGHMRQVRERLLGGDRAVDAQFNLFCPG